MSAAVPALRPTYGGIINQTLGSAVCRTGSSTWKTKTGNLPDDHRSKQGKLNGSSRILRLWDQSIPGKPPQGYVTGTEYTKEEIDKALALEETEGRRLVPSRDFSGHGTAVLGIAAGNGRASGGVNCGVAYESELLVVKMGNARENSFPRTTELMEGIDYLVRQAVQMGKPIAINISFGNNYGSHEPYN